VDGFVQRDLVPPSLFDFEELEKLELEELEGLAVVACARAMFCSF
jgi:hypothetical protein